MKLEPGEEGLSTCRLDKPLVANRGDLFSSFFPYGNHRRGLSWTSVTPGISVLKRFGGAQELNRKIVAFILQR